MRAWRPGTATAGRIRPRSSRPRRTPRVGQHGELGLGGERQRDVDAGDRISTHVLLPSPFSVVGDVNASVVVVEVTRTPNTRSAAGEIRRDARKV